MITKEKEIREEFDEKFSRLQCNCPMADHNTMERFACPSATREYDFRPEVLKDWIISTLSKVLEEQQNTPIGYSQWIAYGKKFGYHDYLLDELEKKIISIISESIDLHYAQKVTLIDLIKRNALPSKSS